MSRITEILITAGATVCLAFPAAAEATVARVQRSHAAGKLASVRLTGDPVTTAVTIAERYWAAAPCGGQVAVKFNQALVPGLDRSTDGWVTFESSLGSNDLSAPASSYSQCTITLAHWQWPTWRAARRDWPMLCLTVIHEMGHLLGHPHSLTPGSVMAPVFSDESSVPAICRGS